MRTSPWVVAAALLLVLAAHGGEEAAEGDKLTRSERRAAILKEIQRLRHEEWAEREAATRALESFGSAALPFLTAQDATDDADFASRLKLLVRLARLSVGEELGAEVADLVRGYAHLAPGERAARISQVVRRSGAAAVPFLLGLLDAEDDEEVLRTIVTSLSWLTTGMDGLQPLLKFYARCPDALKGPVLQTLAGIRCDEARQAAREALENGNATLQLWAIHAIARLGDREALGMLRKLAKGGESVDRDLQLRAVEQLVGMYDTEAAPIFRTLLTESKDPVIRLTALNGIAGIHDRGAAPLLLKMLEDENEKDLHEQIVDAMGPVADPSFVPVLTRLLLDPNAALRINAINALMLMDARQAGSEIAEHLTDQDPDVQATAVEAVASLQCAEAIPKLKKLLNDPNLELAHAAAVSLANLGDAEGLQRLLDTARRLPEAEPVGGELVRAANDAVMKLSDWQVPEAYPILKSLKLEETSNEILLYARYSYRYEEESFRELLKRRLRDYLARGRSGGGRALANFYQQRGLEDLAIRILEGIVRRSPNDLSALDRLASGYYEHGRYAEGEAAYARLEALAGVNATYLNNRAWFMCTAFSREHLKPELALSMAERAVSMSPRSTYIVDTLGWALYMNGKHEESVKQLRRAFDLKEGADRPGRAWQRTRIARPLWAMGRKDEALNEVATALSEAPEADKVWFEAAGFYAGAGMRDEAVHALHKAVECGWVKIAQMKLNTEFDTLRADDGYASAVKRCAQELERLEQIARESEEQMRKELGALAGAEEAVEDSGELFIIDE